MQVSSIIALCVCFAALTSAAAVEEPKIISHLGNLIQQLQNIAATTQNANLAAILNSHLGQIQSHFDQLSGNQRGIFDTLAGVFGLNDVWGTISSIKDQVKDQFFLILEKLLFAGSSAWSQAKPILSQLHDNLIAHATDAKPLITAALAQLTSIVSSHVGKREITPELQRGFFDSLSSIFGLDKIWSVITALHGSVKDQFFLVLEKLLFAGSSAWSQAKPIFSQLVSDLTGHASDAQPLLTNAIAALQQVLAGAVGKREITPELQRGFWDTVANVFGLNKVWAIITALHGQVKDQFFLILEKLLFAGTSAWSQAKPIFSQLVSDLTNHASDASPLLANAVAALQQVLAGAVGKRDLALERGIFDTLASVFNLNGVWSTITAVHGQIKDQFFLILEKLLFAGSNAWSQAKPIFSQLVSDLTNHATDAKPLLSNAVAALQQVLASVAGKREITPELQRGFWDTVANVFGLNKVWAIITALHGQVKDQFFLILEKLLFAGTSAWSQAKPIFSQLVSDLTNHASDASPLLANAVAALQQVLAGAVGKRDLEQESRLWETLSSIFGLNTVWATIQALHGNIKDQFIAILGNLLTAGTSAWAQAKPIFSQLVSDLTGHASDAKPLLTNAVAALQAVLAGAVGKREITPELQRGFWDTVSSTFGLSTVWSTITHLSGKIKDQFFLVLEKLLFAGTTAWSQAKPIFSQLVSDLTSHAQDASPLIANAIQALQQVIAASAGKRGF